MSNQSFAEVASPFTTISESIIGNILYQEETGKATLPDLILGAPGTSKTERVKYGIRKALEDATGNKWGVNDFLRLAQVESIDMRGAMYIKNDRTRYAVSDVLPNEERDGKYGIWLIDELMDGPDSNRTALMQVLREGRLGDYVKPKHWYVVGAGNRGIDRANAKGANSSAFMSRFIQWHVDPVADEFLSWSIDDGKDRIHPWVVNYLKFFPEHAHEYPDGMPRGVSAFANWRSWEIVSDILKFGTSQQAQRSAIIGTIGKVVGSQFCAFLNTLASLPQDISVFFDSPESAPTFESDRGFALLTMLARKANEDNFMSLIQYASRYSEEHTANAVFLATAEKPDLLDTDTYVEYKSAASV